MSLAELFDRHGCDKGFRHRYHRAYEPLFAPLRFEPITLLEIGVLRGASLAAWTEYFPCAEIVGVDTFERVPADSIEILKHSRVHWFKCDSTKEAPNMRADIIIDDGNHIQEAQRATFLNFMPRLKGGGRYFIEDVLPFDAEQPAWLNTRYPENTIAGHRELMKTLEPYVVIEHDLRDAQHPTSYMLEIRNWP